jgi:hypothetical protein
MKHAAGKCIMVTNTIQCYDKGNLNPSRVCVELEVHKSTALRLREYRQILKFNFLSSVKNGKKSQW